ncbi:MAG TPA: GNAT family N-acetyltransferase [Gaiellaceae bacterium]
MLRRFTHDDVDNLVELDGDPDVMRFINGGRSTPRDEIEGDVLPAFLDYYERFAGYGFWAAIEKSTERFVGWFHFGRSKALLPMRSSSVIGCASRPGGRATRPKARAR